ncbi:MAG TPA: RagB/SusD family nutrient uptake outer membrane protein [Gemmatimonadaceae bacterium]|nr:RagB/SusD family nutrient uptake outer membrane protein [Gemmatimonadaceae bacterium]
MNRIRKVSIAAVALSLAACELNLQNPNAPTVEQVTGSVDGVIALATGLQGRFAESYGNFIYMAGLVTDEFAATSAALISISDAEVGSVAPGTGIAENVFNSVYRTVRTADDLLSNTDKLPAEVDAGTKSGLVALGYALKAEALGEALQSYQKIPIVTFGVTQPEYVGRDVALPYIRALIDSAANTIATQAPSAFFNNSILTPGVSLTNYVQLLRARYARIANDDATALAAANSVSRTSLSALTYPSPAINFYTNVTGGPNGIGPRRSFRLSMESGDQRSAYFVVPSTVLGRIGTPLDVWAKYTDPRAVLPLYYPDEALLIKAEVLARQNQLGASQAALDSVRTDCPGGRGLNDPKACLAPLSGQLTQAQLIDEIYKQRRFELYSSGLRWEDSRRRNLIRGFNTATDGQRCWLPYAIGDRNANTNVPPDPVEPTSFPSGCPL